MAVISEYMIEFLGIGNMFLMFGGLTFLIFIFLNRNIKETQGL